VRWVTQELRRNGRENEHELQLIVPITNLREKRDPFGLAHAADRRQRIIEG
jgi:hypothetical protein